MLTESCWQRRDMACWFRHIIALMCLLTGVASSQLVQPAHPQYRYQGLRVQAASPTAAQCKAVINNDMLQSVQAVARTFPLATNITETCNATIQTAGLSILWASTNGPDWTDSSGWCSWFMQNQTRVQRFYQYFREGGGVADASVVNVAVYGQNCLIPAMNGTLIAVPDYCCWHGIQCCTDFSCGMYNKRYQCDCSTIGMVTAMTLPRNNLAGHLEDNWLNWVACDLKLVDFAFNDLHGSINGNISRITRLEAISLSYNKMSGTVPGELGMLPNLLVLDLTGNQLTGSVPTQLCDSDNGGSLMDLLLASNPMSGTLDLTNCTQLVQLDITGTGLNGTLPSFAGYYALHILRLGNNGFTNAISGTLANSSWLTDLDLSFNNLNGTLPDDLADMRLLAYIRLDNNNLTGTIPINFFSNLGMLTRASMRYNYLTGTIPDIGIQVKTIMYLDVSDNYLVGRIPDSFGILAKPDITVNLESNWLSCCGLDPLSGVDIMDADTLGDAYGGLDWAKAGNSSAFLPPYLAFSKFYVPVPPTKGTTYTNMRCPALRMAGNVDDADTALDWNIDPSYYLYYGCQCEGGFELVNHTKPNKLPLFLCEVISQPWYVQSPWILVVALVGAVLVIITVLFLFCYRKGAKPAFVQQYFNVRKRLLGEPKEGMVTIVTTDIEGYSDLMKREPELMGKGLRIHNYCIDKARWQFFGFTLEQEGDSFIIAFYEPFDAVAFCLQAQLLLQRVEWPEKLLNPEGGAERPRKGSMLTQALAGAARILMRDGRDRSHADGHGPMSNATSLPQATCGHTGSPGTQHSGSVGSPPVHALNGNSTGSGSLSEEGPGPTGGSRVLRGSSLRRKGGPTAIPEEHAVPAGAPSMSTGSPPLQEASGIRLSAPMRSSSVHTSVFHGLRVRMGIATGKLEKGTSLRSSSIMERSKVVSDAAAGGQVLMDGQTFCEVKARLVELGAVDHNGLSLSKMSLSRPTLFTWLCGLRNGDEAETAVALDMGQYVHSSSKPTPQSFVTSPTMAPSLRSFRSQSMTSLVNDRGRGTSAAEQAANMAVACVDDASVAAQQSEAMRFHLYQVVSPALVERVHHFGSKLALNTSEWICVDPPYFNAPGAAAAALGLDASSSIPPITMVFCMVDGAKDWGSKILHDKGRRSAVQHLIRDVLINTLMAVKGGYMCRLQEDEFKYMVAFPEPEDAAKWCLIIQDALMWQDWPEWLLKQDKAKEEIDDKGTIVFRGPRLRMGMCHGCPRAIVPDHMGRADYHGASINSAARYMDAAAHGGQIVCEEETAMAIIERWNRALRNMDSVRSTASRLGQAGLNSTGTSAPNSNAAVSAAGEAVTPVSPWSASLSPFDSTTPHTPQFAAVPPTTHQSLTDPEVQFPTIPTIASGRASSAATPSACRPASVASFGIFAAGKGAQPGAGRPPVPPVREPLARASAPGSTGATNDSDVATSTAEPISETIPKVNTRHYASGDGGDPSNLGPASRNSYDLSTNVSMGAFTRDGVQSTDGRSTAGTHLTGPAVRYDEDEEDNDSVVWRDNAARSLPRPSEVGGRASSCGEFPLQRLDADNGVIPTVGNQGNSTGSLQELQQQTSLLQPGAENGGRSVSNESASNGYGLNRPGMLPTINSSEPAAADRDSNLSNQAVELLLPPGGAPTPAAPAEQQADAAPLQHDPPPPSPFAPQYKSVSSIHSSRSASHLPSNLSIASRPDNADPSSTQPPEGAAPAAQGNPERATAGTASSGQSTVCSLPSPEKLPRLTPPGILKVGSSLIVSDGSHGFAAESIERGSGNTGSPSLTPTATSMQKRPRGSVRIQVPDFAERPSTARQGTSERDRDRPSNASSQSAVTTYRTSVSVHRLGGFMFKGSPDEIPMVCLLLENHAGRRFPADPPKGKGGRTSEASGVSCMAPVVELPNIARRYYWAYRANHQDAIPATPRGASAIKGWAVNLVGLSSRNSSQWQNVAPDYTRTTSGGGSAVTPSGGGRVTLSGMLGRSKNLLSGMMLLKGPGSRNARHMLARASDGMQSEGMALADTLSLPMPNRRHTMSNGGQQLEARVQINPVRSDSISSFVDAAEEGMRKEDEPHQRSLQQQHGVVEMV